MTGRHLAGTTAGAVLLAAGAAAAPPPAAVVGNGLVLDCSQPEPLRVRCNYRLTSSARPLDAKATIGALALPPPAFAMRTGAAEPMAVLLLVDTSDPGRAPAIRKVAAHIVELLAAAPPHQRFGLAVFDSDMRLLAPIGSDHELIQRAASGLTARGRTTELYRNVVAALKLLAATSEPHKVLVVMSDGLAEDSANFHADAVSEANRRGIVVYGIGYPRSVTQSVGLQILRRLADETGGGFLDTGPAFDLPKQFVDGLFAPVANVGALSIDLTPVADGLPEGPASLHISLETSGETVDADVPIVLPSRSVPALQVKVVEVEVPRVVEVPVPAPPVSTQPIAATSGIPLWYWMVAIGLLALALVVLLLVLLLQRRQRPEPPVQQAQAPAPDLATLAKLTLASDTGNPSPINTATFRIGRLADNDLVLSDPSVSRHHAEIRRQRDGRFMVLDLGSMNGILVNGKRIEHSSLADGDSLEIGDVEMSFTLAMDPDRDGGETVLMRTGTPERSSPDAGSGEH